MFYICGPWAEKEQRRWRVSSEGCAGREGRRLSEVSGREYRGGVSWKGRWGQSFCETCSRGTGSCSECKDGQVASEGTLAEE